MKKIVIANINFGSEEYPKCCSTCQVAIDALKFRTQTGLIYNDICLRCPLFNCSGKDPLMPETWYNQQFAYEFKNFFETGKSPILTITFVPESSAEHIEIPDDIVESLCESKDE